MARNKLKPRTVRARQLRVDATDAELKLWYALSNRQVAGAKFRRQVPIDRYFADFACVKARLIVELDGGQHADQEAYDARRSETLAACGWRVIRFWNNEVLENLDGVIATIEAELGLSRA
jgi:very-short-patch-repair endonuclease